MDRRALFTGFSAGAAVTAIGFMLAGFTKALDAGISLTHATETAQTLRKESDVLKAMAEPHWLGLTAEVARERLTALEMFSFDKGEEGLVAQPVYLRLENGRVAELQTHCARLISTDCPKRETN